MRRHRTSGLNPRTHGDARRPREDHRFRACRTLGWARTTGVTDDPRPHRARTPAGRSPTGPGQARGTAAGLQSINSRRMILYEIHGGPALQGALRRRRCTPSSRLRRYRPRRRAPFAALDSRTMYDKKPRDGTRARRLHRDCGRRFRSMPEAWPRAVRPGRARVPMAAVARLPKSSELRRGISLRMRLVRRGIDLWRSISAPPATGRIRGFPRGASTAELAYSRSGGVADIHPPFFFFLGGTSSLRAGPLRVRMPVFLVPRGNGS